MIEGHNTSTQWDRCLALIQDGHVNPNEEQWTTKSNREVKCLRCIAGSILSGCCCCIVLLSPLIMFILAIVFFVSAGEQPGKINHFNSEVTSKWELDSASHSLKSFSDAFKSMSFKYKYENINATSVNFVLQLNQTQIDPILRKTESYHFSYHISKTDTIIIPSPYGYGYTELIGSKFSAATIDIDSITFTPKSGSTKTIALSDVKIPFVKIDALQTGCEDEITCSYYVQRYRVKSACIVIDNTDPTAANVKSCYGKSINDGLAYEKISEGVDVQDAVILDKVDFTLFIRSKDDPDVILKRITHGTKYLGANPGVGIGLGFLFLCLSFALCCCGCCCFICCTIGAICLAFGGTVYAGVAFAYKKYEELEDVEEDDKNFYGFIVWAFANVQDILDNWEKELEEMEKKEKEGEKDSKEKEEVQEEAQVPERKV